MLLSLHHHLRHIFGTSLVGPLFIAFAVFSIFMYTAVLMFNTTESRNASRFQTLIQDTEQRLEERFKLYQTALYGGLGLIHASDDVTREEWLHYVNSLNLEQTLPGINGIGYIDYVKAENLPAYVANLQKNDLADFKNHPQTDFNDKFIIKYIDPIAQNKQAVGLDIGFESNRREAAERARDTGAPALTGKIELVQDAKKEAGFLFLLPDYETLDTPERLDDKRRLFRGWVYAPFIGSNFLNGLTKSVQNQIGFRVYDGHAETQSALIYDSSAHSTVADAKAQNLIQTTSHVTLGGRTWTMKWFTTKNFIAPASKNSGWLIIMFGALTSLVLFLFFYFLMRQRNIIAAKVHEQTDALRSARNELLSANEDLEEFAYRTSHDLRSPLLSAISLLDLSHKNFKSGNSEQAYESLKLTITSLNGLLRLVEDILTLTKAQKAKEQAEYVEMDALIEACLTKFRYMPHFERLKIATDIEDDLKILTMPSRIKLIAENLITNAIKYQDPDEDAPFIKITSFKSPKGIFLIVEDNGMGIPENKQKQLFQMFKRFHPRASFGSGLGLYMVKKSAELMGGKIKYKPADTKGSIFTLALPPEADNDDK